MSNLDKHPANGWVGSQWGGPPWGCSGRPRAPKSKPIMLVIGALPPAHHLEYSCYSLISCLINDWERRKVGDKNQLEPALKGKFNVQRRRRVPSKWRLSGDGEHWAETDGGEQQGLVLGACEDQDSSKGKGAGKGERGAKESWLCKPHTFVCC